MREPLNTGAVFLSNLPAGPGQRRLALAVALAGLAVFAAGAAFARQPLPAAPGFVAAHLSALVVVELVVAALLAGQFAVLRARALLVLGGGFLLGACAAVLQSLTLGAAPPQPAWWDAALPLAVAAYALLKGPAPAGQRRLHSVLDLWLMVALGAWLAGVALSMLGGGGFDVAFYAARMFGLLAPSLVLALLLAENAMLYAYRVQAASRERQHTMELDGWSRRADDASRARADALAGMAHDLRTPLNAIIGFSELLKDGLAGEPLRQRDFAARIFDSGQHLLALLNRVIERPRAASGPVSPAPVDAPLRVAPGLPPATASSSPRRALVIEDDRHASDLLRLHLEDAGFEVQCIADAGELARATRRKPDVITLDLLLRGKSGWDVLDQIRNDPALAAVPVVICSVIAEQQKGFALGASMVLQKPVSRETLHAAVDALRLRGPSAAASTVLVVDDDPLAIELVAIHLEDRHCKVLRALDGASAIRMARELRPDLMILDLLMPGINGFDVVEAVRSDPALATVPILVMSGKTLTDEDRRRLDGHVLQVMDKAGFDRERFMAEVGRALHAT